MIINKSVYNKMVIYACDILNNKKYFINQAIINKCVFNNVLNDDVYSQDLNQYHACSTRYVPLY